MSTKIPSNHVVLGNGKRAVLLPLTSWNRIYNPDGSLHCNHGDYEDCNRSGHETISLYEVVDEDDPRYFPPSLTSEQMAQSRHTPAVSVLARARDAEAERDRLIVQRDLLWKVVDAARRLVDVECSNSEDDRMIDALLDQCDAVYPQEDKK